MPRLVVHAFRILTLASLTFILIVSGRARDLPPIVPQGGSDGDVVVLRISDREYFESESVDVLVFNNWYSGLFSDSKLSGVELIHHGVRTATNEVRVEGSSFAQISVKDTGKGIPESDLPFVFDRFHQSEAGSSRSVDGTGIGLALAKEMVELHHGKIEVESTEDFGTTFTVSLPVGTGQLESHQTPEGSNEEDLAGSVYSEPSWLGQIQDPKETAIDDESGQQGSRPTVLVIDDNEDVREYLKGHLADLYTVHESADGSDGLEMAFKHRPDLILADIMMPGIDGYEMCRRIKENDRTAHIPVIMLTARASEEAELEGLAAGADDYISKPFSAGALLARVENLIEIRRLLRMHFTDKVTIESTGVTVESADAAFLARVRDVVENHLDDGNFSVEWLADEVGLSTRHLRRKLRELVSLSPGGFIRMIRLQRAAELLRQQAGNVSEIAYRVGFNDTRYFSRLFQQTFGVAPSAYPVSSSPEQADRS